MLFLQINNVKKFNYKQRCHEHCFLQNVPKEIIGSPELRNCAAIDQNTFKCRQCGCDFMAHLHVYYLCEK